MRGQPAVSLLGLTGIPQVRQGDDVGALVVAAMERHDLVPQDGDLLVVTSKLVSKASGLTVPADEVADRAALVLRESTRVVSERTTSTGSTRVVAALAGPVMAGAGIDASNTGDVDLLLLPHDPDAAAQEVRRQLRAAVGTQYRVGVVLSDTAGRPWRAGLVDLALGLAGVEALDDLRGRMDEQGRPLAVTIRCLADEVAAAADLVKGKVDGVPVALVRGLGHLVVDGPGTPARQLVRSGPDDWFALGRAEAVRDALGVEAGSARSVEVGIASVHPESSAERAARALRVALDDDDVRGTTDGTVLALQSTDAVRLGRVWGRVEVALAGEGLSLQVADRSPGVVTGLVTPRPLP